MSVAPSGSGSRGWNGLGGLFLGGGGRTSTAFFVFCAGPAGAGSVPGDISGDRRLLWGRITKRSGGWRGRGCGITERIASSFGHDGVDIGFGDGFQFFARVAADRFGSRVAEFAQALEFAQFGEGAAEEEGVGGG